MEGLTVENIIKATGGQFLWGDMGAQIKGITTDSRKSGEGTLFIPIEGETFDGHQFIRAAFDGGAVAAITHKEVDIVLEHTLILVPDTLKALADIARYYRSRFSIPCVAVTGSVGKTTTKDMLAASLETGFNVLRTQGNFNNEIGLPLTLFGLNSSHNMAVLEMGMNHFGEIHNLASMAKPNVAVITNIGMSHIEHLGSQRGILKAKLEITDFFDSNSLLVLNGDDALLWEQKDENRYKTIFYGIDNPHCDYCAKNIRRGAQSVEFDAIFYGQGQHIYLPIPGEHNVYNALACLAVSGHFGLEMNQVADGIRQFRASGMRMDISESDGITLINDCYNASPSSMEAAIKVLCDIKAKRRIAILGDILEMGDFAPDAHRQLGKTAFECGVDFLITTGDNGKYICDGAVMAGMVGAKAEHFGDNKEIIAFIKEFLKDGDAVLVKASRGMKFEQIVQSGF